jgi:tetratricopeptide (TPR) repeat protein
MNSLSKARLAIVAILISVLVATLIVGPGVYRIRLEKQKANLYAKGAAALATHQWGEALRPFDRVYPEQGRRAQGKHGSGQALAQFEKLSLLDSNYRNGGERLIEAHYLAGVVYLEAGQFNQAVSEFSQVSLDYRDTEDKLAQALDGSMVHVPAGEFIMGNDSGNPDERPQRPV